MTHHRHVLPVDPGGSAVRVHVYRDRKTSRGNLVSERVGELAPDAFTLNGRVVTILGHNPGDEYGFSWGGGVPATSPPVADFTASPASGVAPLPVTFTDTSTGSPTSRGWDFGDGTIGGGSRITHTFYEPGTTP